MKPLTDADIELAQTYIAYVRAWRKTGKYQNEERVKEMRKKIMVSKTSQPTVYDVWIKDRQGVINFNPVEVRWKQKELGIQA